MDLRAAIIQVTPFVQNCTLLWCVDTMQAVAVDPGGDLDRIMEACDQAGAKLEKILVTHGHIDHAGGVAQLAEDQGIPIEGPHRDDQFWIDQLGDQGRQFGMSVAARPFTPDRWLEEGDEVQFGNITLKVRHCPGHTPGHVIFFHEGAKLALVGDVLFKGSIGRTDFPRGNHADLIQSITEKLWPLGDDITFISGHGPLSTFGEERQTNDFVSDRALGRG